VRIRWSEIAVASAARFIADQDGMHAVNTAVAALTAEPDPPGAFIRGVYRRLRVGDYRVLYTVEGDLITVVRVDRVLPG
jgi:mRNA interferase RelE/StbE